MGHTVWRQWWLISKKLFDSSLSLLVNPWSKQIFLILDCRSIFNQRQNDKNRLCTNRWESNLYEKVQTSKGLQTWRGDMIENIGWPVYPDCNWTGSYPKNISFQKFFPPQSNVIRLENSIRPVSFFLSFAYVLQIILLILENQLETC